MNFLENYYIKRQNNFNKKQKEITEHFYDLLINSKSLENEFNLICILSKKSLIIPARSENCMHVEAFEFSELIKLIKANFGSFKCFCGVNITFKNIFIDEFLKIIIKTYPNFDNNKYLQISKETGFFSIKSRKIIFNMNLGVYKSPFEIIDILITSKIEEDNFNLNVLVDSQVTDKFIPISIVNFSNLKFPNEKLSQDFLIIYSEFSNLFENEDDFLALIIREIFIFLLYIISISHASVFIIDLKYFIHKKNSIFLNILINFLFTQSINYNLKLKLVFVNSEIEKNLIDEKTLQSMIKEIMKFHMIHSIDIQIEYLFDKKLYNEKLINFTFLNHHNSKKTYEEYIRDLIICKEDDNYLFLSELRKENIFKISQIQTINNNVDEVFNSKINNGYSFEIINKTPHLIHKIKFDSLKINDTLEILLSNIINNILFYFIFGINVYTNLGFKSNIFKNTNGHLLAYINKDLSNFLYIDPCNHNKYLVKQSIIESLIQNSVIITNVEYNLTEFIYFEIKFSSYSNLIQNNFLKSFSNILILIFDDKVSEIKDEDKNKIVLNNITLEYLISYFETECYYHFSINNEITKNTQEVYIFQERTVYNYKRKMKVREIIDSILSKNNLSKLVELRQLFKAETIKLIKSTYHIYT